MSYLFAKLSERKIKHLNEINSVSLVVKVFSEITPCASIIIVLNQEILLVAAPAKNVKSIMNTTLKEKSKEMNIVGKLKKTKHGCY